MEDLLLNESLDILKKRADKGMKKYKNIHEEAGVAFGNLVENSYDVSKNTRRKMMNLRNEQTMVKKARRLRGRPYKTRTALFKANRQPKHPNKNKIEFTKMMKHLLGVKKVTKKFRKGSNYRPHTTMVKRMSMSKVAEKDPNIVKLNNFYIPQSIVSKSLDFAERRYWSEKRRYYGDVSKFRISSASRELDVERKIGEFMEREIYHGEGDETIDFYDDLVLKQHKQIWKNINKVKINPGSFRKKHTNKAIKDSKRRNGLQKTNNRKKRMLSNILDLKNTKKKFLDGSYDNQISKSVRMNLMKVKNLINPKNTTHMEKFKKKLEEHTKRIHAYELLDKKSISLDVDKDSFGKTKNKLDATQPSTNYKESLMGTKNTFVNSSVDPYYHLEDIIDNPSMAKNIKDISDDNWFPNWDETVKQQEALDKKLTAIIRSKRRNSYLDKEAKIIIFEALSQLPSTYVQPSDTLLEYGFAKNLKPVFQKSNSASLILVDVSNYSYLRLTVKMKNDYSGILLDDDVEITNLREIIQVYKRNNTHSLMIIFYSPNHWIKPGTGQKYNWYVRFLNLEASLIQDNIQFCSNIALFICKVLEELKPIYEKIKLNTKFINKDLGKYLYNLSNSIPMISYLLDKRIELEFDNDSIQTMSIMEMIVGIIESERISKTQNRLNLGEMLSSRKRGYKHRSKCQTCDLRTRKKSRKKMMDNLERSIEINHRSVSYHEHMQKSKSRYYKKKFGFHPSKNFYKIYGIKDKNSVKMTQEEIRDALEKVGGSELAKKIVKQKLEKRLRKANGRYLMSKSININVKEMVSKSKTETGNRRLLSLIDPDTIATEL